MKRDIYKKLMNLQSSEANTLLDKKFSDLDNIIRNASDNDEIYKQLEALEQFVYKVSEQTIKLATYLLGMDPLPVRVYKTQYGPYEGKKYGDIVKKVLDILSRIRFYQTREIISIYFNLYTANTDKLLEDKIRDIARYDLQALNHIGYGPQLQVIDFLHTHKTKDEKYVKFFIEVAQHLATTEGESHRMKDENTFEFGFAPLPYNKDIKHIRDWLIDETKQLLLKSDTELGVKIKLVDLLSSFTHGPHRGEASKELDELIEQNTRAVVEIYAQAVKVTQKKKLILPLALEIEEKLIFIERGLRSEELLERTDSLIKDLQKNYSYSVYRVLISAKLDFLSRKNETYEEARKSNEKERRQLLETITSLDSPAVGVLEDIANYLGEIEQWKLNSYEGFLSYFAKEKPTLAYRILENASEKQTAIVKFAGNFIVGFRNANAYEEYANAVDIVVLGKHREPIRLICFAMTIGTLSDKDIAMATEILHRQGRFRYLLKKDEVAYQHYLMEVFIKLLPLKNEKYDKLFIEMLNSDRDLSSFDIATVQHEITFEDISENVRQHLINNLISVRDVSYQHQELLLKLYNDNAEKIVDFFIKRAKFKSDNPKLKSQDFDPVPYHLNKSLTEVIKNDGNYLTIFKDAISSFTPSWSIYNSEVAQLFKRTGGYEKALLAFLNKPKKADLKRVLSFFDGIDPIDLDVAVEIAKHTDDKKIWSSIRSGIYTTGIVSGEYGLANEHQKKYDYLKKHYAEDKSKRVRLFVEETLAMLEAQVKSERQRTEESLRLRKVDFEH